jgi:hypothetical protein
VVPFQFLLQSKDDRELLMKRMNPVNMNSFQDLLHSDLLACLRDKVILARSLQKSAQPKINDHDDMTASAISLTLLADNEPSVSR